MFMILYRLSLLHLYVHERSRPTPDNPPNAHPSLHQAHAPNMLTPIPRSPRRLTCISHLPLKNIMVKLKPHIPRHLLHARLHIILQIAPPSKKLR